MARRTRSGAVGIIIPLMVVLAILSLPFVTIARPARTGHPLSVRQEDDDDDDLEQNPNGATTAFTDPVTGIQYQRFFGAKTTFNFGIALPQNPSNSFIGRLDFPLNNGAGYGALSLQGRMDGPLMLAAWTPDGTTLQTSFRQVPDEDEPPEVQGAFSVRMIQAGTSINNTRMTMTFLCEGCMGAGLGLDAAQTAGTAEMGWALSNRRVGAASNSELGFHNVGFGAFAADLAQARFAEFDTWVAMADAVTVTRPANGARPVAPGGAQRGGGGGQREDDDSGDESGDDN